MGEVDYSWADGVVGQDCVSIGTLGTLLRVGRHQARRRLVASGLPYRVYRRVWTHPSGRIYTRKAIAVPLISAHALYLTRLSRIWTDDPFGLLGPAPPFPLQRKLNRLRALALTRKIQTAGKTKP